jgi:hypothetical protein
VVAAERDQQAEHRTLQGQRVRQACARTSGHLGKLRNDIDHHNFTNPSDIGPKDVKRMIDGIRDFVVKYLT